MSPVEKRAQKLSYEIIDKIAKELKVSKIKFYLDPLVIQYLENFNSLKEFGYIDSSSSDSLLDLTKPINVLWKNLRKSYKALINRIIKSDEYQFVLINKNNPDIIFMKCTEKCMKCSEERKKKLLTIRTLLKEMQHLLD